MQNGKLILMFLCSGKKCTFEFHQKEGKTWCESQSYQYPVALNKTYLEGYQYPNALNKKYQS